MVGGVENDGRIEKWNDRKYFNFSNFCLVESGKVEGWKKWFCINLLISLLKNDSQLKQKSDSQLKIYLYTLVKKWWPIKTKKWQKKTKNSNHPIY